MFKYSDIYAISIYAICIIVSLATCEIHRNDAGAPCSYFGADRVSKPEGSLVNCSWYAGNACCKRTEVTSVFGGMYPLFGATKECSNQINYLMCYFCSPEQIIWYNRKAFVCEDYCNTLYEHCATAEYNGTSIGSKYASGQEFCHGQRFEVTEGTDKCFKFDPTVFSNAYQFTSHSVLKSVGLLLLYLNLLH